MPRHPCPRLPQGALGKRERTTPTAGAFPLPAGAYVLRRGRRRGALMELPGCVPDNRNKKGPFPSSQTRGPRPKEVDAHGTK